MTKKPTIDDVLVNHSPISLFSTHSVESGDGVAMEIAGKEYHGKKVRECLDDFLANPSIPTPRKVPRIEPHIDPQTKKEDPLKFIVESDTNEIQEGDDWKSVAHHVNLGDAEISIGGRTCFAGSCDCADYTFRLEQLIAHGQLVQCKHIEACMIYRMRDWTAKFMSKHA